MPFLFFFLFIWTRCLVHAHRHIPLDISTRMQKEVDDDDFYLRRSVRWVADKNRCGPTNDFQLCYWEGRDLKKLTKSSFVHLYHIYLRFSNAKKRKRYLLPATKSRRLAAPLDVVISPINRMISEAILPILGVVLLSTMLYYIVRDMFKRGWRLHIMGSPRTASTHQEGTTDLCNMEIDQTLMI